MGRATVHLSEEERRLLDELAREYGSRSAAIRAGLRLLFEDHERRKALADLVASWEAEDGPADEAEMERMAQLYDL